MRIIFYKDTNSGEVVNHHLAEQNLTDIELAVKIAKHNENAARKGIPVRAKFVVADEFMAYLYKKARTRNDINSGRSIDELLVILEDATEIAKNIAEETPTI